MRKVKDRGRDKVTGKGKIRQDVEVKVEVSAREEVGVGLGVRADSGLVGGTSKGRGSGMGWVRSSLHGPGPVRMGADLTVLGGDGSKVELQVNTWMEASVEVYVETGEKLRVEVGIRRRGKEKWLEPVGVGMGSQVEMELEVVVEIGLEGGIGLRVRAD